MSYIDDLKIVWLMPVRTCTRTTMSLLREGLNVKDNGHLLEFPKGKEDYTLVFNIRNPLPRIVSIYWLWGAHQNNFEKNFREWLYDYQNWETTYQLHLDKLVSELPKKPNFLVRTEFYHDDLMQISILNNYFTNLGEKYNEYVFHNGYPKEFEVLTDKIRIPWQSEYDEESAEFVYKLCKGQFEMFNYNPNYWKDGTP